LEAILNRLPYLGQHRELLPHHKQHPFMVFKFLSLNENIGNLCSSIEGHPLTSSSFHR
ncbi:hypothetical protein HAX54_045605, partial [Datura stramonium]|nr:hypothetical protein [Datura stramonium]